MRVASSIHFITVTHTPKEAFIDELLDKEFYHPTLEEGLRTAFKHARRQLNG